MIGQTLRNRYTITAQLGKGAMGVVYRATDSQTGQAVAIKVIARELAFNDAMLERFKREGEALYQLRHPNIVGFVDAFQHNDQYVIVMEYVPGGSLNDHLKRGQLPVERARRIALELCDALTRVHHLNIIHRDLKPENILIAEDGTPKLTDFGVAKLVEGSRMTRTGTQVGTPYYMSPEAWEGKPLDGQADIWSLGVVLYEMLSGEVPFDGDTLVAVMNKVLTAPLPDIKKKRPDVPDGLARILRRMLIRKKADRYQTVREVALDLERAQAGVPGPSNPDPLKIPSWVGLATGIIIVGACAMTLLGGGIWAAGALQRLGAAALGQETASPTLPANNSAGETAAPVATLPPATEATLPTRAPKPGTSVPVVSGEPVTIRWFVGLGTGTNPDQISVQEEVVADFNASQEAIDLVLEVIPYDSARDTLSTYIAADDAPDIVGPVGWSSANGFYGQWLDLTPYINESGFDTSVYDPVLIDFYRTEEGQVGLPFAVYPAATYYVPALFDQAGLNYPPQTYGEPYVMPNGDQVDWTWDTLAAIARILTLDANGNNATSPSFDRDRIVQIGYAPQWQTHTVIQGTYIAGAAKLYTGTSRGDFKSNIPSSWKAALKWEYDGMWGEQPFIATGPLAAEPDFGNGNLFNSGKVAMAVAPIWYTCCLLDFSNAGLEFQAAAIPADINGKVHGRVDADTFRIWSGTSNPEAAFTVMSYLLSTGADKLLPAYGALPAIESKMGPFFQAKSNDYPFVTQQSWDVFVDGLSYPDTPSAEQYQPNWTEAWAREQTFFDLLQNTPSDQLDFDAEWQEMIDDLNIIYNQ